MSGVTNELVSRAMVALFISVAAYAYVRWRRNYAVANARSILRIERRTRGILKLLVGTGSSYELNLAMCSVGAFVTVLLSLGAWAFFLMGVVQAARGTLRIPLAFAPAAATPAEPQPVAAAVLAAVGMGMCVYGAYVLGNCRRLARYYRWLHDFSIPLDSPYLELDPDGDGKGAELWRLSLAAWGSVLAAGGLGMLLIAWKVLSP